MAKKKKYYVVWEGVNPGVYDSWADCQLQIKGFPGAKYKAFKTEDAAKKAFVGDYDSFIEKKAGGKPILHLEDFKDEIIWDSIAVDAACSGNPGVMEYQGVDTKTGMRFFHKKFDLGTNNIGEFLALVHGLAWLKQKGMDQPIYTDSKIAMGWIKAKTCRSKLVKNEKTKTLHQVIARAETWLKENTFPNKILKWDTERWGEIPADFGRK